VVAGPARPRPVWPAAGPAALAARHGGGAGCLLQALDLQPQAVLGHSAGAALMLQLALDGRLPGARLLGLNAALLPFDGWAGFLFPPLARLLALNPVVPWLAAWRAQDPAAVRRLIAATGSRLDDAGVAAYAALLRQPTHVAGVLAMMASWDLQALQAALPRLQRPLHLLVADRDGTVPPAQAERLAARWPASVHLHRLQGLGHLAHEEAPGRVAAALAPLLAGTGRHAD
jgi:magnesium chelatase accessory protein